MKAKVAPKKLYIDLFKGEFNVSYSPANNSIEYVHTDAFIKKACEWLKDNASNYIIEHPFSSNVDFEEDKMIEDFKKYMKGE